jgi:AbrB family looped-hinge helix DNA binding protein
MTFTTTMTQKGQVTIPKHIRTALNVDRDSKFLVLLDEEAGVVKLKPLMTLEELAGSLKSDISLTDAELKEARKTAWGSRWVS